MGARFLRSGLGNPENAPRADVGLTVRGEDHPALGAVVDVAVHGYSIPATAAGREQDGMPYP